MPTADILTRKAQVIVRPATLDSEAGTVEAVIATGGDVRRGGYVERLDVSPQAITLPDRVSLLDSHRQGSVSAVIGHAANFRFEGNAITATLKISDPATLARIERGDVTGVSIGYAVSEWQDTREAGTAIRTAKQWEVLEVSIVAVPADPQARVRSIMEPEDNAPEPVEALPVDRKLIRSIGRDHGLEPEWADDVIDTAPTDVEAVRTAAVEAKRSRQAPISTIRVGPSHDDPAHVHARKRDALYARMSGEEPSEAARPYMNHSLVDLQREALEAAGISTRSMSRETILSTRAGGMHTTSDLPELLTGAGNRTLAAAYKRATSPIKRLARRRSSAPDFRPMSRLKVSGMSRLEKVVEGGEITAQTIGEAVETFAVETYGSTFALSRNAIVNDDLGAFGGWGQMMGQAAADTEAELLFAHLTANGGNGPKMGEDGKTLFHASHGNLADTGAGWWAAATVNAGSLDAARQALRTQKGMRGEFINVTPKYLLVGPDLETEAEKLLAEIRPATTDDVNPFAGRLTLLVEPRLADGSWYVFADPAAIPVIEYAYLAGSEGPQLSSRDGWDVLGREFRVVLDFGCGVVDWRGAYRNPGE